VLVGVPAFWRSLSVMTSRRRDDCGRAAWAHLSEVASLTYASNSPRKTPALNSDFLAAVHVTVEAFQPSHAPPIFLLLDFLLDTSGFGDGEAVAPESAKLGSQKTGSRAKLKP